MHCPVVYHPQYQAYYFGPDHPFSPVRLEMLWSLLEAMGCAPEPVAPAPVTDADLTRVHSPAYVEAVRRASQGLPLDGADRFGLDTPDVPIFEGMDDAARCIAGGTLRAAQLVADGTAKRVLQLGGGLHHAQYDRAAGFCVYNDLSVAIRHLRDRGLRVAYIDVDVHHGDGVQALHDHEHEVLTVSLHQSGRYFYPGTGFIHELGEAAGRGFKLNVPLEAKTGDESYLEVFELTVPHALAWFAPDVLVVQCGADAHFGDPLADLLLSSHAFERVFRRILELAEIHTQGRAVFTLGGGYELDATVRVWALLYLVLTERPLPEHLPEAWVTHWRERLGQALTPTLHDVPPAFSIEEEAAIAEQNRETCRRMLNMAARCWY